MLPAVQDLFDKKVERNKALPANVIRSQQFRLDAPYMRTSLEFPNTPLGDGDGLRELRVAELHGLCVDQENVNSIWEIDFFRKIYPSLFTQIEGVPLNLIEMRIRLLGFDTQEAPRGPGGDFLQGNSSDSEETSMSMTLESLVTVMVLISITGYCWTFVASMIWQCWKVSLFQHYQGLRWLKGHCAVDMLFQQLTTLFLMICEKNFRTLFSKGVAVSP